MKLFPPYHLHSSAARLFGIKMYGGNYRDRWWWPLVWAWFSLLCRVDDLYHYVSWRVGRHGPVSRGRWLRIDIHAWADSDEVVFQAVFASLRYFVEYELGPAKVDTGPQHRGFRVHASGGTDEQAIDLWFWYKFELPQLEADYEADILGSQRKYPYGFPETVKDEKLLDMINIRRSLWV